VVEKLKKHHHSVVAVGNKAGHIGDTPIVTGFPEEQGVDTVTLYLNPVLQEQYYQYILSLKPKRIIFNPGTENAALSELAKANDIVALEACTLVLLGSGQY
jgi:hypothetical protein